ncbi:MAG TPA: AAA family ATPase [Candidatus Limnocylindria bacterium]|nr:AAA family ATPase [Candidatus Limnocylindria bacterium]
MIGRHRRSVAASKAQTREYAERIAELVPVLRSEIPVPAAPAGSAVVVVLMGPPGVGKSHCARLLAARLGAAHVSSDHLRSRLFIAASYAPEESATIFRAADMLCDTLLAEGHRVIVDATNLLARHRATATATARRRGVPIVHVRVVAEERDARERLARRRLARAEHDHSDADERVFERMRETFEPPEEGHLVLANGTALEAEIERVAAEVERRCASAT